MVHINYYFAVNELCFIYFIRLYTFEGRKYLAFIFLLPLLLDSVVSSSHLFIRKQQTKEMVPAFIERIWNAVSTHNETSNIC